MVPYTSLDQTLIDTTLDLFNSLYQRRVLIRLIGVKFSHLIGGSYQIRLFEDTEKLVRLYKSMDIIRNRFGQQAVMRAVTMGVKSIGGTPNPFNGQPPVIPAHRRL
jgi:DNA polymerase-4